MSSTTVPKSPPRPITDHRSFVWRRNDAVGTESDAKQSPEKTERPKTERPWLVLSRQDVHERLLFCGAMMTSALARSRMARCVSAGAHGFVDTQHLWTYSVERIRGNPASVEAGVPAAARTAIRQYFTPSEGEPSNGLAQGRIVWVRLAPRPSSASQWGDPALMRADIVEHTTILERLGAVPTQGARPWVLPAMVLTSDQFLPPRADHSRRGMFPLVTVVPLVTDRRLIDAGAERISHPRHPELLYAPVASMLLSLDYNGTAYDGHPRVRLEQPGFENWRASSDVVARVVARVLSILKIIPEAGA